ncbi:MAG: DUF58 domain-containing protein [Planctomycetes bacterium]|nr:DUF58 domain-containing protein [Planctomycetota bacterium]
MATASRSIEWTLRGKVVAWLTALAAGAAWLGDDTTARLAAAMLAAPLVVDFVAKQRRLHHTEVQVSPRRTVAGALFVDQVTVVHHGRRPARECLFCEPRTMRHEPPLLLPTLPPGRPVPVALRGRSLQRSHVVERVFVLASSWPLALFRSRAVIPVATDFVTEPARVPLSAEVVQALAAQQAAPLDRAVETGLEFHSLREHLPHEDARSVHALRSAALGTLVRRVTRGRLPQTVGVVLDLRRPPGRPLRRGTRRFEWSLGACAALVAHLRRQAAQVLVLVLGEAPARFLVQGPVQEHELLTLLAAAEPSPHRPLGPEWFDELRRLEHCFWIPAGAYAASPEIAAMPRTVTLVGGEME